MSAQNVVSAIFNGLCAKFGMEWLATQGVFGNVHSATNIGISVAIADVLTPMVLQNSATLPSIVNTFNGLLVQTNSLMPTYAGATNIVVSKYVAGSGTQNYSQSFMNGFIGQIIGNIGASGITYALHVISSQTGMKIGDVEGIGGGLGSLAGLF